MGLKRGNYVKSPPPGGSANGERGDREAAKIRGGNSVTDFVGKRGVSCKNDFTSVDEEGVASQGAVQNLTNSRTGNEI